MVFVLTAPKIVVSGAKPDALQLMKLERQNMQNFQFDLDTLLNGSPVTVTLAVCYEWGDDFPTISLDSVWFDGANVLPILDEKTLSDLEMQAESALHESGR